MLVCARVHDDRLARGRIVGDQVAQTPEYGLAQNHLCCEQPVQSTWSGVDH